MKKLEISVQLAPAAELRPAPGNSRVHSDAQIAQIEASVRQFGWTKPILHDGYEIVAGHGARLAALRIYAAGGRIHLPPGPDGGRELPEGTVPVLDCSGWSEAQRRAYVIADNKIAENSTWDDDLLRVELKFLDEDAFDLGLLGFDDKALAAALESAGDGLDEIGTPPEDSYREQHGVIVVCASEDEQRSVYEKLKADGYNCRVVTT